MLSNLSMREHSAWMSAPARSICVGFHHGGRNAMSKPHTHAQWTQIHAWAIVSDVGVWLPEGRWVWNATGKDWGPEWAACYPGGGFLGSRREPGVRCVASPSPPGPPKPAICPLAAGPLAWALGLLLGFEPVASWEPVTLRLGPFQFFLFRKVSSWLSSVAAED